MTRISVDSALIKEALAQIELQEQALQKLASLQRELDTVYQVLNLIKEGHIDFDEIESKIQDFIESPESLAIFKKAVSLRSGGNSFGRLTSSDPTLSKTAALKEENPEARLFSQISTIIN